jgi:hypothetical protein
LLMLLASATVAEEAAATSKALTIRVANVFKGLNLIWRSLIFKSFVFFAFATSAREVRERARRALRASIFRDFLLGL